MRYVTNVPPCAFYWHLEFPRVFWQVVAAAVAQKFELELRPITKLGELVSSALDDINLRKVIENCAAEAYSDKSLQELRDFVPGSTFFSLLMSFSLWHDILLCGCYVVLSVCSRWSGGGMKIKSSADLVNSCVFPSQQLLWGKKKIPESTSWQKLGWATRTPQRDHEQDAPLGNARENPALARREIAFQNRKHIKECEVSQRSHSRIHMSRYVQIIYGMSHKNVWIW